MTLSNQSKSNIMEVMVRHFHKTGAVELVKSEIKEDMAVVTDGEIDTMVTDLTKQFSAKLKLKLTDADVERVIQAVIDQRLAAG